MFCPNCGAEIKAGEVSCQYCGYENEALAGERHRQEVKGIYARISALLKMPEETVRKATKLLLYAALGLVGLFLLALLVGFIYMKLSPEAAYRAQREALEELEELYQQGDYAAMAELLYETEDSYGAVFDKYYYISELYLTCAALEESCPETAEFVAGFPEGADLLDYELQELMFVLSQCDSLEEAGFVYGEEREVTEFRNRAYSLLTSTLMLTEPEIEEGLERWEADGSCEELRRLCAARLTGGTK